MFQTQMFLRSGNVPEACFQRFHVLSALPPWPLTLQKTLGLSRVKDVFLKQCLCVSSSPLHYVFVQFSRNLRQFGNFFIFSLLGQIYFDTNYGEEWGVGGQEIQTKLLLKFSPFWAI